MKNIFVIFMLFFTVTVSGQSSLVGVKGGASWTNGVSEDLVGDVDFRNGLAIGLTYDYTFKRYFSAGIDIIYNQRGFINSGEHIINLENSTKRRETFYYNCDYITVPLKIGFNYGKRMYGFINIGLTPSILVSAISAQQIIVYNDNEINTENREKSNIAYLNNKFDIGGFVEIGGGYKFKEKYWLYSSFIYQHSFTPFTNKNYFNGSKIRHYGMILSLGLKININQ